MIEEQNCGEISPPAAAASASGGKRQSVDLAREESTLSSLSCCCMPTCSVSVTSHIGGDRETPREI